MGLTQEVSSSGMTLRLVTPEADDLGAFHVRGVQSSIVIEAAS